MSTALMVRHLEHNDIDFKLWDDCIENSRVDLPYAFSWYLDIVCDSWSGLVYGNYEAVMPLPYKKKFGIRYVYQPFFTQQLGIYGNLGTSFFLNAIPKKFVNIHSLINYTCEEDNCELIPQINLVLDLRRENYWNYFSNNCKRNIKKAEQFNLNIKDCNFNEIIKIFRANKGMAIKHLKEKNYEILESLLLELNNRKMICCFGIYSKLNELLGGVILIKYKKRIIFFFSALSDKGKEYSAMFYLINYVIKIKQNDFNLLDFEGSNNKELARFYKGFGAHEQNYFSFNRKLNF